jgi:hypothetical protein
VKLRILLTHLILIIAIVSSKGQYNTSLNSPVLWNPSPASADIPFDILNVKFGTPTTNGGPANISILSNNWALGGGYGLLNGDNVVSPLAWMYAGGQNAFTVAKMDFTSSPWDVMGSYLTPLFQVRNNGNVGIGTVSPETKLEVKGNLRIYGTDQAWSEGISIVKATGWSGIKLLRSNPTAGNFNGNWAMGYNANTGDDFSISTTYNNTQYDGVLHISNSTRNVGIGTTTPGSFKLAVNGKIWTQEVNVAMTNPGPDYVFEKDYELLSLTELENYINQNKHLPEIPSANEMEKDGLNLKEMNLILLKKVEELTLHLIEMNKKLEKQNSLNKN